jgi:sugar phosphate permease
MDVSSEIIHSLLPMFLMASLGASATTIGLIEGIAEATAPIIKVFSGTLSDYLGNRKWLAVAGYGLGALSKPLFAVAPTIGIVVTARIMDRVGKGIRGAPRDARGRCHATTSARCCIRTSSVSGHRWRVP